jgi:signal peptidase I
MSPGIGHNRHARETGERPPECSKATALPPDERPGPVDRPTLGRRGLPRPTAGRIAAYPAQTVTDPSPTPATDQSPRPPSRRAFGCLIELVETVVLTAIIFIVLQSFVAQPFKVEQVSMRDTIEEGQYVLVDKLTPHFDSYHRGDIIVFAPPANAEIQAGKPYIKRIIGVAGDRIVIQNGQVLVNGIVLDEPYLFAVDGTAQPTTAHNEASTWTVPADSLFVMGDHRERSADSRDFGPILVKDVVGRAWLRYWPLPALGVLPTDRHPELGAASSGAASSPGTSSTSRPASAGGASSAP